jgi:putative mRNA 3-end processing factor
MALLEFTSHGIYCKQADVFIDPWGPVKKALITHAHSDHARKGMKYYLAHKYTVPIMKYRLGDINADALEYNQEVNINNVKFSFHPAGHIIGSSQIRVEHKGEVWVASGDYKTQQDPVATNFEPIKCHSFITECTFGLPVFQWEPEITVMNQINDWWKTNAEEGNCSVIAAYSLGKAQRVLQGLDQNIGQIYCHGAVANTNDVIDEMGISLNKWQRVPDEKIDYSKAMIIAPPSAFGSAWINRFKPFKTASASGWMQMRGNRRRRGVDRGFVLSDHADWNGLNEAIKATGAENIIVTHGYKEIFRKWLEDQGYNALIEETDFDSENVE